MDKEVTFFKFNSQHNNNSLTLANVSKSNKMQTKFTEQEFSDFNGANK